MRAEDFDIQELIDYLQGTTNSLSGAISELYPDMNEDDLTSDDLSAIDNEIFLCEQCGWFCETSEAHESPSGGGDICDDCHSEQEDDDE